MNLSDKEMIMKDYPHYGFSVPDVKQAVKELKEDDLYRTLVNKFGKAEVWRLNTQDLIEAIEDYYNKKVDKIFGDKLTKEKIAKDDK